MIEALAELFVKRGTPERICSDYGPEYCVKAIREWLDRLDVDPSFIEAGSPWENGYCESYSSKLREELLNCEIFYALQEAKILIENWRFEHKPLDLTTAWGDVLQHI